MGEYSVEFTPLVGGVPFHCGSTYTGIGSPPTTIQPIDWRMYIYDISLVRATGDKVSLTLTDDGEYVGSNTVLLDFEDGTGLCNTASPDTNTVVKGTAAANSDYTGVSFTLGVPHDVDHLDVATAKAPLNVPAMWWSWNGGYRYLRADVAALTNEEWNFHLGAMYCQTASSSGVNCKYDDLSVISATTFKDNKSSISLDLATLYADSNLEFQVDGIQDTTPGCMSEPGDPECAPLFHKVGLLFDDAEHTTPPSPLPTATFFVAE